MLSNSENQRGRPFRPGQSGNPKGRPRGAEDFRKRILKALHAKRDGKRAVDALIDSLLTRALAGNLPASKVLVEYAYGKPVSIADVIERDTQAGTVILSVPEEAIRALPVFTPGGYEPTPEEELRDLEQRMRFEEERVLELRSKLTPPLGDRREPERS